MRSVRKDVFAFQCREKVSLKRKDRREMGFSGPRKEGKKKKERQTMDVFQKRTNRGLFRISYKGRRYLEKMNLTQSLADDPTPKSHSLIR